MSEMATIDEVGRQIVKEDAGENYGLQNSWKRGFRQQILNLFTICHCLPLQLIYDIAFKLQTYLLPLPLVCIINKSVFFFIKKFVKFEWFYVFNCYIYTIKTVYLQIRDMWIQWRMCDSNFENFSVKGLSFLSRK